LRLRIEVSYELSNLRLIRNGNDRIRPVKVVSIRCTLWRLAKKGGPACHSLKETRAYLLLTSCLMQSVEFGFIHEEVTASLKHICIQSPMLSIVGYRKVIHSIINIKKVFPLYHVEQGPVNDWCTAAYTIHINMSRGLE